MGCVLLILAAGLGPSAAQLMPQSPELKASTAFFYKDPRVEGLVNVFATLKSEGRDWTHYPPVTGLLARSFVLHPDWIERLVPPADDSKAASAFLAALRLSGHAAEAGKYRNRFGANGLDSTLEDQFSRAPARLEDITIRTPTDLDLLWGASFVEGDGRYVRMILDFFASIANQSELIALDTARITVAMVGGPKDIYDQLKQRYDAGQRGRMVVAAAALWAVGANARQHDYVRETTADYIRDHKGTSAVRALSAITGLK
ncbi:conserved exported protein of unknown function [Bradyrhizobium sp. ORS 285]|uniref:hypothetical protein n=2 Tax=Bradyrhizobium sp. ORS 285 TaxID=115808 RepID=UPI0002409A6B|nr:hypothetical protein [Bradyrhizobium sp. ORS 285]CCD86941.1 conserved exported hypothetical protein [Bradyrhizobium sp. ORS 285]SMX61911.1 conserved exported protein of unknown function [Bradyrhizobium sp. ORS 285]